MDQTFGYLTEDGGYTTEHPKALLFNDIESANAVLLKEEDLVPTHDSNGVWHTPDVREHLMPWIDEVEDEQEFRSREDTW